MSDKASGQEIELMEQIEAKVSSYFDGPTANSHDRAAELALIRRIIQCAKQLDKLLFPEVG